MSRPVSCQLRPWISSVLNALSLLIARVKFESRAKFESGSIFSFFDFFLLFISYGCYFRLHNDVPVANRKNYKCLVCNIAIFFIIDRLSHYCYDSLSLYKDIPHTYLMKFLRRLTPVFAYTWSRDSISAAEKARGEEVFKYPLRHPLLNRLFNRHLVFFHRTRKIKCNASRTYSLRGRDVASHVIFLSNTI